MPADSGLRRVLSSSLSICRTLNLREKSFTVPRSQETALVGAWLQAGWSVSEKIPTNKIFLPQIPALGAKVFHPFNSPRPAQLNRFSDYYNRR
ncbi:MAG: hypothetical protein NTX09_12185 [Verrucomicrobia bacterium]|nr:hypothetical protein [Verrucomicrobiota bacterium]